MIRFPEDDDVLSFNPREVNCHPIYKAGSLKQKFCTFLQNSQKNSQIPFFKIFSEGHKLEVMTTSHAGWRKARLKIVFQIEFDDLE